VIHAREIERDEIRWWQIEHQNRNRGDENRKKRKRGGNPPFLQMLPGWMAGEENCIIGKEGGKSETIHPKKKSGKAITAFTTIRSLLFFSSE
jgi:hypothetical protein